jgi:hypothetical protein
LSPAPLCDTQCISAPSVFAFGSGVNTDSQWLDFEPHAAYAAEP